MVTVGKPMGNGHPISAVITTKEIARDFLAKHPDVRGEVSNGFVLSMSWIQWCKTTQFNYHTCIPCTYGTIAYYVHILEYTMYM
jgi:hypothetical protein